MEFQILSTLEFDFFSPSSYRFLQRYKKLSTTASDDQIFFFSQYLCEIVLLDAYLLKYKQSEIAASCFIISAKSIKGINAWNSEMEKWTGIKEKDLKNVVAEVKQFLHEVNAKFLPSL